MLQLMNSGQCECSLAPRGTARACTTTRLQYGSPVVVFVLTLAARLLCNVMNIYRASENRRSALPARCLYSLALTLALKAQKL